MQSIVCTPDDAVTVVKIDILQQGHFVRLLLALTECNDIIQMIFRPFAYQVGLVCIGQKAS